MRYKILFLDIDGTLVTSDKKITPAVKNALTKRMKNGVKVAIASGRPYPGTRDYAQDLGLEKYGGYVLSFNGANILDCKKGEVVQDEKLSPDVIAKTYELAKRFDLEPITYKGDTILSEDPENKYVQLEAKVNKMPIKKLGNLLEEIEKIPEKCLVVGDEDKVRKAEETFSVELSGKAKVFKSEPVFLEIMPPGLDKATSIEKFIKSLGIKREETMAFGDGYNDISMIKYAGIGVAMKNAFDEAKKASDFVTEKSNDENGVAEFLDWYDENF